MAADCALGAQPFPLRYSFGLLPYGVVYISFSVIYYWCGGVNEWGQPWIYAPIYWGGDGAKVGAALCVVVVLFLVPALILAAWGCVRLRDAWAAGGAGLQGGAAAAEDDVSPHAAGSERLGLLRRDGLLHPLVEEDDDEVFAATPPAVPPAGELREFAPAAAAPDEQGRP